MMDSPRILIVKDCRQNGNATGQVGTYEGRGLATDLYPGNPKIRLDDDSIIWGIECWWQVYKPGDRLDVAQEELKIKIEAMREWFAPFM